MNTTRRAVNVTIALFVASAWSGAALAAPNEHRHHHHHHNGPQLLGDKLKANGRHQIDRNGHHTVSVDVKDGKVAAFHAHHATNPQVSSVPTIKLAKSEQSQVTWSGAGCRTGAPGW